MECQWNALKTCTEDGSDNDENPTNGSTFKTIRFSLQSKKWTYRGEGNANVVIALPQERKVIRLRKSNSTGLYSPEESATFSLEAHFCSKVMIPLLGACYVDSPSIISIDSIEISELEGQLAHQRPVSRLHKVIQSSDAALYMDFAILPKTLSNESPVSQRFSTYCVEIKPKQGWVPKADRRIHKCGYCLQQYHKVMTGKVDGISQYCPLDLFSGNSWRMKKALCSLLEIPQNNLKVFKDGNLVYGEGTNGSAMPMLKDWLGGPTNISESIKLLDKFYFVVMEALLRDMTSNEDTNEVIRESIPKSDMIPQSKNSSFISEVKEALDTVYNDTSLRSEGDTIEELVNISIERIPNDLLRTAKEIAIKALKIGKEYSCSWEDEDQLPANCVLQRILNVQKLDSEGADSIYKTYHHKGSLLGVPSNFSYVPSLMDSRCVLSPIHRYLLATTAKDCSIMLTFKEDSDNRCEIHLKRHILQCPDGQRFLFNVGVIDLEPKPISCIEKHARRDCDLYSAYVNWHL